MAQVSEIKATARPKSGKGSARQARAKGQVPGVIYGDNKDPQGVLVDYNDLWKLVNKGRFFATVFDVAVDGQKSRVLPRAVQFDPVKDFPIHVDFHRIGSDGRVRVNIPVKFTNEALSPGLKRGGVLNIVRHEVEVFCPADHIPTHFETSLEGLEIGRSIHISAFKLPEGVRPVIHNRDFTVATIAGAITTRDDAEAGATATDAAAAPAAGAAPAAAAGGKAPAGGAPAAGGKAAPAKAPAQKK